MSLSWRNPRPLPTPFPLPLPPAPPGAECIRVGGTCPCPFCGQTYYKHPYDPEELDGEGYPFLHVRCDGARLKL